MNRAWIKTAANAVLLAAPTLTALVFLLSAVEVGLAETPRAAADVDAVRTANAERDSADWTSCGRT